MRVLQIQGIDKAVALISSLKRSQTIEKVLESVGQSVRTVSKHAIESQSSPDTKQQWQAVKEKTKRQKGWKSPLYRSGDLWREAGEYETDNTTLAVLYGIEYAKYHQEGTKHIPQRRFLPTQELWYTKNIEKALSTVVRKMQL